MKVIKSILLLGLFAFIFYVKFHGPVERSSLVATRPNAVSSLNESVPHKALEVLQIVRTTGQPPEGYVGGRVFQNREGRLPADGDYREFDVDPHNGGRNAERIIVEWNTRKAWYTGDHYQTFTPVP